MPQIVITTSILGLFNSSGDIISSSLNQGLFLCFILTPRSERIVAIVSPPVFIVSNPHSTIPILSGYSLFFFKQESTNNSAAFLPLDSAAIVGISLGSKAYIALPDGYTSGSRIGSPPREGKMYLPSKARRSPSLSEDS